MRILSYNIRVLGSGAKITKVKELIQGQQIEFCCVHETKKEIVDELLCISLWGNVNFGWAFIESEGRAGGILSIWNSNLFSVSNCYHMKGVVAQISIECQAHNT
ncbi:hypothetical protein ACS0TY_034933 [Phlomoides rotata]